MPLTTSFTHVLTPGTNIIIGPTHLFLFTGLVNSDSVKKTNLHDIHSLITIFQILKRKNCY